MFSPVLCLTQEWHAVCQRVRRVQSVPVMVNASFGVFCGFLVSSWCLVHMVSPSFAGLPAVYKTWVTQVCLLVDTPFGRRSVGALPL